MEHSGCWNKKSRIRLAPLIRLLSIQFLFQVSPSISQDVYGNEYLVSAIAEKKPHKTLLRVKPTEVRESVQRQFSSPPKRPNLREMQGIESEFEKSNDENTDIQGIIPFYLQIIFIVVLVAFSGIFSGLTLGLMSLDKTGLEIVMGGDDPVAAKNAKAIYPVRSNGNLLLTTLLLGNVAVNALLSILMADITSGTVGFIVSTAIIVVFGEILPQAWCSRYALQIGSKAVPLVRVIIFILYVIAAPLGYALDKLLGGELATVYSKSEMIKLLQIHVDKGMFDQETGIAMTGALNYKDLLVKNVMTPLHNVFMLNAEDKLSFDVIASIFKAGYSRIPVYEISENNIIGLLFAKDLIFVDPADETSVKNMVQIFGRGVHVVWPDDTLGDVLRELKQGKSHMALVRDVNNDDDTQDPFYEIKGIITLEDIIEEILGDEIVDETDAFVDPSHNVKVDRDKFDWARLRLLDAKITDEMLSKDEVLAITAHLRTNFKDAVNLLSDSQLHKFVANTRVSEFPTAEQEFGEELPRDLLYEKGVGADSCTLILSGKIAVLAGSDNFRCDVSSWSLLAIGALTNNTYAPDFTAFVSNGPCRCIRFTRERFIEAVDASSLEKRRTLTINVSSHSCSAPSSNSFDGNESDNFKKQPIDLKGIPRSNRKHLLKAFRTRNPSSILEIDMHDREESSKGGLITSSLRSSITKYEDRGDGNSIVNQDGRVGSLTYASPGKIDGVSPLQEALTAGGSYVPRPRHTVIGDEIDADKKRPASNFIEVDMSRDIDLSSPEIEEYPALE